MSDLSDLRHWCASEFPNDNPALHDGAIWVCFAPCGPLRPVVRPRSGARPSTISAPYAIATAEVAAPTPAPVLVSAPASEAASASASEPEPAPAAADQATGDRLQATGSEVEAAPADEATGCGLQATGSEAEADAARAVGDEASVTEVGCLAAPAQNDAIPPPPLALEFDSGQPTEAHPAPTELDPVEAATPEGCSLSAGLKPIETSPEDARVSEMRERSDAAVSVADLESVVECTPPPPAVVEVSEASAATDDSEGRRTILPPPSEEPTTLTLTRIHVTGRSQAPAAAPEMTRTPVESANAGEPTAAEADSARPDPFEAFIGALVEVALAAGATRAAAVLPGFLKNEAQDFEGFSDGVRSALVDGGLAMDASGTLSPSAVFEATASAWRMVLRGESNDFSACGTSTLDGWAGDILKSFGVGRDGKVDVKRELRRRGVAAFGMILAA